MNPDWRKPEADAIFFPKDSGMDGQFETESR